MSILLGDCAVYWKTENGALLQRTRSLDLHNFFTLTTPTCERSIGYSIYNHCNDRLVTNLGRKSHILFTVLASRVLFLDIFSDSQMGGRKLNIKQI